MLMTNMFDWLARANTPQAGAKKLTSEFDAPIVVVDFVINLGLAALLAWVLSVVYARCGSSLSNRRMFGGNFVLLAMTTMLIISIVKSSLALSLGLVGALSIVRFRAAIKEPEELAYLFLTIAIGLGFGADQREVTLIAFATIAVVLWLRSLANRSSERSGYCLVINSSGEGRAKAADIVRVLKGHCREVELKRLDETPQALEASFIIGVVSLEALEASKDELRGLDSSIGISFLDSAGVF